MAFGTVAGPVMRGLIYQTLGYQALGRVPRPLHFLGAQTLLLNLTSWVPHSPTPRPSIETWPRAQIREIIDFPSSRRKASALANISKAFNAQGGLMSLLRQHNSDLAIVALHGPV